MLGQLLKSLTRHFGYTTFRPGQREAIESLLGGRDTLVVMPTGAGKSLIYQLAALRCFGITVVLSPLIALMKDQVDQLNRRGIPAAYVNSTLSLSEQSSRLSAMAENKYRLVYIAPERLRSISFQESLGRTQVGLLAVDEAHCISHWGHDFRPDYLYIATARKEMGNPVTAALTATATPKVQQDIIGALGLSSPQKVITGFNRPNLYFQVKYVPDTETKLEALQDLLESREEGTAIVYTGTRRDAEETAEFIRSVCGLEARYYHAGMEGSSRTEIQEAFCNGQLPVVTATNAFGMGIDRADVRLVVHYTLPGTLEAYYQEAGRAGRDGKPARAVLLYSPKDRALQEFFIENDPDSNELAELYRSMKSRNQKQIWASTVDISLLTGLPEIKIRVGLSELEKVGAVHRLGDDGPKMLISIEEWNSDSAKNGFSSMKERHRERRRQLNEIIAYAEMNHCRRQKLLKHFGDNSPAVAEPCCDNCMAKKREGAQTLVRKIADISEEDRTPLVILDTVRRLKFNVGQEKLAQLLKGSKAQDILRLNLDSHIYYGRLAGYTIAEIREMVRQLLKLGYFKVIGGELPVFSLTPQGQNAITRRETIRLTLPRRIGREAHATKVAEREAGGTVQLTSQLLAQGLSVEQIASQRGLKVGTIFDHCARLIEDGQLDVTTVVAGEKIELIRNCLRDFKAPTRLSEIKALLPDSISFQEIRCVIADANGRRNKIIPDETGAISESGAEPESSIDQIVAFGENKDVAAVPQLVERLTDPDGNIRRLAASALGKIGDLRAAEPLMALLQQEEKPQVREYAVKALGKIGDARCQTLLEKIADNPLEMDYTRAAAKKALKNLDKILRQSRVREFLSRPLPRPLVGPWDSGWALGFHSRFSGSDWDRSQAGDLAYRLKYKSDISVIPELVMQIKVLCSDHPELLQVDALVPVPPTATRVINPVAVLAEALGKQSRLPVLEALHKTRKTLPQKNFHTLAQKRANVKGAFRATAEVRGKRVLVIDDLFDSGATLEEISRVLRNAGAKTIRILTITRTIHSDA